MPIEIDGGIIRNIPEQVAKNQEDIEELQREIEDIGHPEGFAKLDENNDFTGSNNFAAASVNGDAVATQAYVGNAIDTVKRNAFI